MALTLSLSKHCLLHSSSKSLTHFSPKLYAISPAVAGFNGYFHRRAAAKFSAIATESAPAPSIEDDTAGDAATGKIVLPTNQSSEKLLRIRHTVKL